MSPAPYYAPSTAVVMIMDAIAWPNQRKQWDPERLRRDMLEAQAELIRLYIPRMHPDVIERAGRTLRWIKSELGG